VVFVGDVVASSAVGKVDNTRGAGEHEVGGSIGAGVNEGKLVGYEDSCAADMSSGTGK